MIRENISKKTHSYSGLYEWSEIAKYYPHSLLLGNGASIAIYRGFDYKNLFKKARSNGLIEKNVKKAFNHFTTSNFEYVLNMLWHVQQINKAIGVHENKSVEAYRIVRTALFNVIILVHPDYNKILFKLPPLINFVKHFDTVVDLNYDLLLYWASLYALIINQKIIIYDGFIPSEHNANLRRFRKSLAPKRKSILVLYPHGNIAFTTDIRGNEQKVHVRTAPSLLNKIQKTWESEELVPIFVAEGSSEQKLSRIYRSKYLTTVYENYLPILGPSIAVFGWSFGDVDNHILTSIARGNIKRIAISIHATNPDWRSNRENIRSRIRKAFLYKTIPDIHFYDASSVGLSDP